MHAATMHGCIVYVMLLDIIYSKNVPICTKKSSRLTVLEEKL